MENYFILQMIALFLVSAIVIWISSNRLSVIVENIDDAFKLGDAFGGTILLSIVTNLPEIIIVIRGVQNNNTSIALGNILGGIALQTLLLVLFDFASRKESKPLSTLTYHTSSLIQGFILCIVLSIVIMGAQFQTQFVAIPVSPVETMIIGTWLIGLFLLKRGENTKAIDKIEDKRKHNVQLSKKRMLLELLILATVISVFGVLLANTSESISNYYHIDGVIFGATILALVTSLPEISSGLKFIKLKKYTPIISDILGGNAFLPTLFFLANILAGRSILTDAHKSDLYLVGLSLILVLLFMLGMITRQKKRIALLGLESWLMVLVYVIGALGLLFV